MSDPIPVPTLEQVDLDARLDDEGRPLADPNPTVPDDVPEEKMP